MSIVIFLSFKGGFFPNSLSTVQNNYSDRHLDICVYRERVLSRFRKFQCSFTSRNSLQKIFRHYQRLSYIHNKHSACTYNAYQLFKCNLNYIDVKLLTCAYFFDLSKFFILYFLPSIYLTYLTRAVIGWLSVFYQSTKHKAQLKRFASLYNIRPFSGRHSSFIFVNWKKNFRTSESVSSNGRTKQRFVNMPSSITDVRITWTETKKEMDRASFKGFHAQLYCNLTYVNKTQHS